MSKTNVKRRLYLAYGSNMNLGQMSRRCPTAKVVGNTMLPNWKLVFNGVASVERSKGDSVPVVVWDIQPKDEKALDIYEGWPRLYRKEMRRIRLDGKLVNAMIYIMNNVRYYSPPHTSYFNTILEGYKSAGFDTQILYEAAEQSKRKEKNTMDTTIEEQIKAVAATGRTNMFDANAVQRIANDMELYELVCFIEDDRRAYSRFILSGKRDTE